MVQPPDNSANPWHQLLEKHPEIQEVPFIIPVNTGTSLVQEHAKLETAVSQVGNKMWVLYHIYTLKVFTGLGGDLGGQTQLLQSLPASFPATPLSSRLKKKHLF